MSYDQELAERVREVLAPQADLSEKRMFGGLAFLLGGRMAVAVSGNGGLMIRTLESETETLLSRPGADVVEMRGRRMNNWLRVPPEQLADGAAIEEWVGHGAAAALAQPPKN